MYGSGKNLNPSEALKNSILQLRELAQKITLFHQLWFARILYQRIIQGGNSPGSHLLKVGPVLKSDHTVSQLMQLSLENLNGWSLHSLWTSCSSILTILTVKSLMSNYFKLFLFSQSSCEQSHSVYYSTALTGCWH